MHKEVIVWYMNEVLNTVKKKKKPMIKKISLLLHWVERQSGNMEHTLQRAIYSVMSWPKSLKKWELKGNV